MLSSAIKAGRKGREKFARAAVAWGLGGHLSAGGGQLRFFIHVYVWFLVFVGFFFFSFIPFLLIYLYLRQLMSFPHFCPSCSLPHPIVGSQVSKRCLPGLSHNTGPLQLFAGLYCKPGEKIQVKNKSGSHDIEIMLTKGRCSRKITADLLTRCECFRLLFHASHLKSRSERPHIC